MLCARYWEAINKWDEALLLTPDDGKMLEMKAQVNIAHLVCVGGGCRENVKTKIYMNVFIVVVKVCVVILNYE